MGVRRYSNGSSLRRRKRDFILKTTRTKVVTISLISEKMHLICKKNKFLLIGGEERSTWNNRSSFAICFKERHQLEKLDVSGQWE